MQITSCDCFKNRNYEAFKNEDGSYDLRVYKKSVGEFSRVSILININNCPFCGKKIEVEE